MTYIPYNSMLFDRLLAAFKYAANVGFLIYVADAFGYLASVAVVLTKTFFQIRVELVEFLHQPCINHVGSWRVVHAVFNCIF